MQVTSSIAQLKSFQNKWQNQTIVFVPTMGNLHNGHLSLVEKAKQSGDKVIVSVFVNPLQFGPKEDFDSYPRSLEDDLLKLKTKQVDLVFTPDKKSLYPNGEENQSFITVPTLNKILCGVTRPHFFQGVATVVAKLFNLVKPDIAIFGEKDYQQLLIIKKMVLDLNYDIDIQSGEIIRENDGLALSSRNRYLTNEQRKIAPLLQQELQSMRKALENNQTNFSNLCELGISNLQQHGFKVDYLDIRAMDLTDALPSQKEFIILAAAFLGTTRLIDNIKYNHR